MIRFAIIPSIANLSLPALSADTPRSTEASARSEAHYRLKFKGARGRTCAGLAPPQPIPGEKAGGLLSDMGHFCLEAPPPTLNISKRPVPNALTHRILDMGANEKGPHLVGANCMCLRS